MRQNNKRAALELIEQMPNNASLEQIMYELYFRERVDRGLREAEQKKVVPQEEVRRSVARWLRSSGR
jgi:predicted transcriptional regulator